jgi:hypothetical protein
MGRAARSASITRMIASRISEGLCGGRLVAMPTAMPTPPLMSRFGSFAGSTVGSIRVPS